MNEKFEIIYKWIEKADHDLVTAKLTYLDNPDFRDTIAFHCQQASEKYLKSLLIFLGISFSKTNDLDYLLSLIAKKVSINKDLFDKLALLSDYNIEILYPDSVIYLSEEDIIQATKIADETRLFVFENLGIDVNIQINKKVKFI